MARSFGGVSDYLDNGSYTLPNTMPVTLAAWFNPTAVSGAQTVLDIGDVASGGAVHCYTILLVNNAFWALCQNNTNTQAISTAVLSAGNWYHGCGVFTNATDRAAYINGANKGTDATSKTPLAGAINMVSMGRRAHAATGQYFGGLIAEAAIWDAALTDAEVAVLATGLSPLAVRPGNLVSYWPVIGRNSPENNRVDGWALNITGTPAAAVHPRVRYASSTFAVTVPGAAPPAVTARTFAAIVG